MRVYLPSTLAALARLAAERELGPAPLAAYAVTPALREWYAEGDLEELEYAASDAAAAASLELLAAEQAPRLRRVVVAADVPDSAVRPDAGLGRAGVRVAEAVPLARVASVHVDDAEAEADVRAALEALPAARAGDEDAAFTVEQVEGHELLWYATQEIEDLLGQ
ncbi:DUF6912 family protein [Motilibacter aurantiacus]|uniref:DUF6912 family protein n=1 Tax=Motilibacter aurantiacus TaxID=2714955 RepID=UPI001408787D|nr:hypothetical protein [Motilibacter aurantiacus]NHC43714.1 hypothetical protein [Motilibacter aurantiacus]